jgi:predicted GTPase
LPAVGYSSEELGDLERSIDAVPCDVVLAATPIDLAHVVSSRRPIRQVRYSLEERPPGALSSILGRFVAELRPREPHPR